MPLVTIYCRIFAITFNLVKEAANYNPLFETPFDGEVGKNDSTYIREGYGVSTTGFLVPLNNTSTTQYTSDAALKKVNVIYSKSLNTLKVS